MGKKRTRSEPCNTEDCGETLTLAIADEFQKLYEKKLAEIDETCDDEHTKEQEKICTLRAWVSDLTEQNKMLIQVVEELEEEASDTVVTLENKLKDSTQKVYNRMSDAYEFYSKQQNELVDHLRNDICNLIEVIRRVREEGRLNADDLRFFEVTCKDVYGEREASNESLRLNEETSELCNKLEKSEKERMNLQIELENCTTKLQDKLQENENLLSELLKLQKSTRDMREALTAEVADKHDSIRALRRENQNLEEQCRQIDKQAHFKDDIIKELRKELRAVKKRKIQNVSKIKDPLPTEPPTLPPALESDLMSNTSSVNKIISYYSRLDKNDYKKCSNTNDSTTFFISDKSDTNYDYFKTNVVDSDEPERLSKLTRDISYEQYCDSNDKFSSTNDFRNKKSNEDGYDLMDCGDSKTVYKKNSYL